MLTGKQRTEHVSRGLAYYYANREQLKAAMRERAKKRYHAELKHDPIARARRVAASKLWRQNNPEKKRASDQGWKQANPDQWRALQRSAKKRQRAKPANKAISNLRCRLRQLVNRGRAVSAHTNELTGCTPAFLVAYLTVRFAPGMTWENYGSAWHIDHATPCAKFDLTKRREVKKCFHFTNLQPLWRAANAEKSDKVLTQQTLAL